MQISHNLLIIFQITRFEPLHLCAEKDAKMQFGDDLAEFSKYDLFGNFAIHFQIAEQLQKSMTILDTIYYNDYRV